MNKEFLCTIDGDHLCVTNKDFVNLMESEAVFIQLTLQQIDELKKIGGLEMENINLIPTFKGFSKIARLSREILVTEKLDGTNSQITITEEGDFLTGSRNRWITPSDDNYGFSRWANENKEELMKLGVGTHFGEWWGKGIQRGYGLNEKKFSLFNTSRWSNDLIRPSCCSVVPILYEGMFDTNKIEECLAELRDKGSVAAPGFNKPEGIVIFHKQGNLLFKKTCEKDEEHKFQQE